MQWRVSLSRNQTGQLFHPTDLCDHFFIPGSPPRKKKNNFELIGQTRNDFFLNVSNLKSTLYA